MFCLSVTVLLCFTGCWCHDCNLSEPYFTSRNFHSVLHWNGVSVPGDVVLYSVQYHVYGELYKPVSWCQNISVPLCDLTPVMTEVASRYYVRITGAGQCLGELMFTPYEQTILEAPKLTVRWNETSLTVAIFPPLGPENRSMENISCWGICRNPVKYRVHLTQPKSTAGRVFEGTSDSVLVWPVETDTEYCGDVVYSLTHPSSPRQSDTASFCQTVTARKFWLYIFVLPAVVAVLLLLVAAALLCQQSVRGNTSLPAALLLGKSNTVSFCPDDSWTDVSKVQVCSRFVEDIGKFDLQTLTAERSKVTGNGTGYASQDCRDLQWRGSDELVPSSSSAGQCVSYSMIVGVQPSEEPLADGGAFETCSELSAPGLIWAKESQSVSMNPELSNSDSSCSPLVVPVVSAGDGVLQLNERLFQHELETNRLSGGLTSPGEKTLLLTDVIVEDLSCNAAYLPVDVSETSTGLSLVISNYRENWLPGLSQERQQDQRTYILRSGHLQESTKAHQEEEENMQEEEESKISTTLLDRWLLKVEA